MPAMTSAMTRGCRSRDKGKCKILQKIRIMEACVVSEHYIFTLRFQAANLYNEEYDGVFRVVMGGIASL